MLTLALDRVVVHQDINGVIFGFEVNRGVVLVSADVAGFGVKAAEIARGKGRLLTVLIRRESVADVVVKIYGRVAGIAFQREV